MVNSNSKPIKILFISPAYFDKQSYVGGGERYAVELAKAVANIKSTKVTFVSFGSIKKEFYDNRLKIIIYKTMWHAQNWSNSFSLKFLENIFNTDVVHIHQFNTLIANLTIITAFILGKKIFITDQGGGGFCFNRLPLYLLVDKFLCHTEFARTISPFNKNPKKNKFIYGGVDTKKFKPLSLKKQNRVLFVGRIMPHKGINYLIEAIDKKTKLVIIGQKYNLQYWKLLKKMARGKNVIFKTNINDKNLVKEYNIAKVTVLPSVYKDIYGNCNKAPELLGLSILESMACGTPVIGTNVGGIPYIIKSGQTGLIAKPNSSKDLSIKISQILSSQKKTKLMGEQAERQIKAQFTWTSIACKCLKIYKDELAS